MPPQQRNPPPPQQYGGYPPRGAPPQQQAPPADMSRIMSTLSQPALPGQNPDLARIMAGMNTQAHPGQSPSATGITPDVARLLGQMGQPPPVQQHSIPGSYQTTPAPASLPSGFPGTPAAVTQPPTSQSNPDIAQLLANLTNYKPPN